MEDYMSTQSVLVKSPEIVGRAAKKPNLQDLKSYPNERPDNVIYLIRENLAVLRDSRDSADRSIEQHFDASVPRPGSRRMPRNSGRDHAELSGSSSTKPTRPSAIVHSS